MKTYTADELRDILDKHGKWVRDETGGSRANLAGANLARANLADAYLADANLAGANLTGAYLARAYLAGANLARANLARANLADANLAGANLTGANLTDAYLTGAYLTGANLTGAYLTGANLAGAYLAGAYLTGAYLTGAYLAGANLAGANLARANLAGAYLADANLDLDQVEEATAGRWRILPDDGSVIGWKKCRFDVVVCLEIPHGARRSNAPGGRKCRADTATVIGVWGPDGEPNDSATSLHDEAFKYRPGETVTVDDFNENPLVECGAGIHFYLTRAEAEAHT